MNENNGEKKGKGEKKLLVLLVNKLISLIHV